MNAREWISSLEGRVPKALWHKPIAQIDVPELLAAVADVVAKYPETGRRVRQRLEVIFDHAEFHKLCIGNPGRAIRRKLMEGKRGRDRQKYWALDYWEVPEFVRRLRAVEGASARALEFGLLTAARTGEILGARWSEIDLDRNAQRRDRHWSCRCQALEIATRAARAARLNALGKRRTVTSARRPPFATAAGRRWGARRSRSADLAWRHFQAAARPEVHTRKRRSRRR